MKTQTEFFIYLLAFLSFSPFVIKYIKIFLEWGFDYSKPWKEKLELPRLATFSIMLLVILFFMKEANNSSNSLALQDFYHFITFIYVGSSFLIWTKKFKKVMSYSPERFGIEGFKVADYNKDNLKKNFLKSNDIKIKMNFEQFINLLYLKGNKKLEPIIILDKGKNNSSANKMILCEFISILFFETNPNLDKTFQNKLLKEININYFVNSDNERIKLEDSDIYRWRKNRTGPIKKFNIEIKNLLKCNSYNGFLNFLR